MATIMWRICSNVRPAASTRARLTPKMGMLLSECANQLGSPILLGATVEGLSRRLSGLGVSGAVPGHPASIRAQDHRAGTVRGLDPPRLQPRHNLRPLAPTPT